MPSREKLSELIAGLYDASIEPEHWPDVLEQFAQLFNASYGGLVLAGPEGRVAQLGSMHSDPSYSRSYGEHYGRMDPVMPAVLAAPTGTMLTDTMVLPKTAMESTEFYQEWVRPQGYYSALAANFIAESSNVGVAVLSRRRQEEEFQQHDLDLFKVLEPHFKQAMRTQWRLSSVHAARTTAMDALDRLAGGIVVTDQSCRIILANRVAEAILAQADGIGSGRSGLYTATAAQTSELGCLISRAAGNEQRTAVGGGLLIDRPSGRRPYRVLISPLRAGTSWAGMAWQTPTVLVLIIDPEHEPRSVEGYLRSLFKLTGTEARVARSIASGAGLVSVANSLKILPSTARTHLHRVFEKTDTRRQAELVKAIGRIAVLSTDET